MKRIITIATIALITAALITAAFAAARAADKTAAPTSTETPITTEEPFFDPPAEPAVTADTVKHWIANWCSVSPGASVEDLVAAMGTPTETFPGEEVSWAAFNYQFNAFLDIDGNVRQMDTNTISLSQAEIDAIPCSDTRVIE